MKLNEVNININGKAYKVPSNYTILQAAESVGIYVPRLCFLKDINETSACRICVVEIEGIRSLKNSCTVKVAENMVIKTNTPRIKNAIKNNLELLAANHHFECWVCPREHNCEFLELLRRYNVSNVLGENKTFERKNLINNISTAMEIDSSKCLLCGRCVSACEKLAGTSILDFNNRGFATFVAPAGNTKMEDAGCIFCGKCIQACPTGALKERDQIDEALELIENDKYYTVVQVAPSVRVALGEEFDYPMGTNVEGKVYQALEALGFDDITDTNFAADLTILEEGTEFIHRFESKLKGEKVSLPLFTSCSPGWVNYLELYYPEFISNLSSCKSPQQMQGAIIKNYYAKKIGVNPAKVKVVAIMPCIAKKKEAARPEMEVDGLRDVDLVLTTRELARMIKREGIDFKNLKDYKPKSHLAKYTGAGVIFGATGGVMEAALRTVKEILEQKEYQEVEIKEVRGTTEGIKETLLTIAGHELRFAVVHGAVNFPKILKAIKENPNRYAFVEFMACTGGCVNGGGQPIVNAKIQDIVDVRAERAKAIYHSQYIYLLYSI